MDSITTHSHEGLSATQSPSALAYESIPVFSTPPKNTNTPVSDKSRSPGVVKFSPEKGSGCSYDHVIEILGKENYDTWLSMFNTIKKRLGSKLDDAASPHVYAVDDDRVEIHFGSGDASDIIIVEKCMGRIYTHHKGHITEMFLGVRECLEIDFSDDNKLVVNWYTTDQLSF